MNTSGRRGAWMGIVAAVLSLAVAAQGENVIDSGRAGTTAEPVKITLEDVRAMVDAAPVYAPPAGEDAEALRVARKLDAHLASFVAGYPFKPFHNTLGISGHETLFGHPDHLFYSVSIALPYASKPTADRARQLLVRLLAQSPPYAVEPLPVEGAPREAYTVQASLRSSKARSATSAFGVYGFWAYCRYAPDPAAAKSHWSAVKSRMRLLLEQDYAFDSRRQDYRNDEAQALTGNLAGLIGFVRLARMNDDAQAEMRGLERARQLLELRVNLDRVNPQILEKTLSASKSLHIARLARYCDLVPEVGLALRRHTSGLAAGRLEAFRRERNAWYMAFGERMIGGENYISPASMSHAMFHGAAFIERLDAAALLSFVDVPWCKGDFYFMEKCAAALWAAGGAKLE